MRRALIPVAVLVALLTALPTHAQQTTPKPPTFNISTDRNVLVQGESFELQITISTESTNDPVIKLPPLTGLRVLSQSEQHPRSFSFSFGFGSGKQSHKETKQQSIYTFEVLADQPGKYTVNPIEVHVDGQAYKSTPYHLNIIPSTGGTLPGIPPQPQMLPQQGQPQPSEQLPTEEIDRDIVDKDYFIQLKFSKESCTVGEMVVLSVYLYTTWNLSSAQIIREPGTEGFWVETIETGGRNNVERDNVRIGDTDYERVVLRKLALFPIKPGELVIAPAVAELEVRGGGFFSRRRTVKRSSTPLTITVNPLPTKDQPADFSASNVGIFSYRVSLDRADVTVGEPVTVVTTVRGRGNMRNLSLPVIKELDGFKVYTPESEVDVRAAGNDVTGNRISRTLMIPKEPGTFSIPDLSWTYYNPQQGKYVTAHSGSKKIRVRPGEGFSGDVATSQEEEASAAQDDFRRLNQQLRTILSRADLNIENNGLIMAKPWFIILVLIMPLGYLAFLIVSGTRRRMKQNLAKGRSKRAETGARRSLNELSGNSGSLSPEQFFAQLQKIIVVFLEERLEVPVAGDTMAELDTRLKDRGVINELSTRTVAELEACDFARFAKSSGGAGERNETLNRVKKLISELGSSSVTEPPKEESK